MQDACSGALPVETKKNVPWHISAFLCNRKFQGIPCYIKKAVVHKRDRQPALPPKLASACRGNSPLISVNAGSTLYLTMQSFRSNPDLRDLSCPLRHFPSLAQSSEAGSTTRTWKLSPSASSLGCRHSSTFPLQCLSDMHI